MTSITLNGDNLGERHHHLNKIVQESFERNDDFSTIENLPEESLIDRIYKINLASKLRNTEYIIRNLKDYDMLYVSSALKSKWLINVDEIINPEYLENVLYPEMITTAVTKMKLWLVINFKNEENCKVFYAYYRDKDINYAIKFLKNCSVDFIRQQFSDVKINLSPHDLKVFCEKDTQLIKMYFNSLADDEKLKSKYLAKEKQYFNVLLSNFKSDPEFVLNTTESIFNAERCKPFGSKATKFIMKNHKERFWKKLELYTVFLLHFQTLPNCLNPQEIKTLVIRLARAKFLTKIEWFNYKRVEPLINKLPMEEKKMFKRKIFVDKEIGEEIIEWPYILPTSPAKTESKSTMFDDKEYNPDDYVFTSGCQDFRRMLKKRKYCKWQEQRAVKTRLDELFDEFRFSSFDKTLYELRKRIKVESVPTNRQYMLLVLVSKSGGHEENVCKLLKLLENHKNEPCQVRAAILRSLVKRAKIWRLTESNWSSLMEFAQGLGLDGKPEDVNCTEGIHAVFIRQLLTRGECDSEIKNAFMKAFSTLAEYSFSTQEFNVITNLFPGIILKKACDVEAVCESAYWINVLLDILKAYKIPIATYDNLIDKVKALAAKDVQAMRDVLMFLFKNKIERRSLFHANLEIIKTEQSYLNALRHDTRVISPEKLIKILKDDRNSSEKNTKCSYKRFFVKLSIYFREKSGLAEQFYERLKAEDDNLYLVKALTILAGNELENYIDSIDTSTNKGKAFNAALNANVHLSRPVFNIDKNWEVLGTKAIGNRVLICKKTEINDYVQKLLKDKKIAKLALVLSKRITDTYYKCLSVIGNSKPFKAIKSALKVLKRKNDLNLWSIIKTFIENNEVTGAKKKYLFLQLADIASFPIEIRPEVSILMFNKTKHLPDSDAMLFLCHIENYITKVDEEFLEKLLLEYYKTVVQELINIDPDDEFNEYKFINNLHLYTRITVKYLLLCKSKETQNRKLSSVGCLFLDKMVEIWNKKEQKKTFMNMLSEVFSSLKYHKVYLDSEYVCCLPIMEQILRTLEGKLPPEKYFDIFVNILLIMFYYKSIRNHVDCIILSDFYDDENMVESFTKKVAKDFSNYIIQGFQYIKIRYTFDSMQYIYENYVLKILNQYFANTSHTFTETLINELLDLSKGSFGLHLFKNKYECLEEKARVKILNKIRDIDDIAVKMIVFGL